MNRQYTLFLLGLLSLSSCAVTSLKPGAEKVVLLNNSDLSQCKKISHIYTSDTNGSTITYTSHERLEKSQVNVLKNQTAKLGGNALIITKHEATYISNGKDTQVNTHRMEGDAYSCPTLKTTS